MSLVPLRRLKCMATSIAFILVFAFSGITLAAGKAEAALWDGGLFTIKREHVRIEMEPGVELIGTIYQKRGLKGPAPLVMLLNPWSIGSWVYVNQANILADKGFIVLSYNLRGWSGSNGTVDVGGPVDVADVSRVIDWASQNPMVDTSRVGLAGVSLGAGVALIAAAYEPRVKAVVSMSTWTNFYTPIYGNSTKRVYWDALLWGGSIIGTGSSSAAMLKETQEAIDNADYARIHAYADPRSPVYLLDRYAVNKPAILLSQNMSDILFPVSDVWKFFENVQTPKKMNLQPGVHATSEITGMFFVKKDKVWDDSLEWFERWLGPNPPDHNALSSEVQVNLNSGTIYTGAKTTDITPAPERFFLANNSDETVFGTLSREASETGIHSIRSGKESGVFSGLPLVGAIIANLGLFPSKMEDAKIKTEMAAIYDLKIPDQKFKLIGVPKVHFTIHAAGTPATFVTHLFRVDKKGIWHLISMTPYTLRDYNPGDVQRVESDLYGAFEEFEAGERLVLALDAYDPEFKFSENDYRIDFENNGQSWIDLPISYSN